MNKEDKVGLIVCSPEMYEYLKKESNGKMPPKENFVITEVVRSGMAFVVVGDEFIDWLFEHGTAWTM